MTLKNKTILITGATAGIGRATAELLAEHGAKLVLTGRRAELLEELKSTLKVPVHVLAFDVRDHAAMQEALTSLPKAFAEIDVLVNNAGLALGLDGIDTGNMVDWEVMVETNILGLLAMTRAVLPGMKLRDRGHIVNISSIAGTYPYPSGNVYAASKAFVTQLSLCMRADLLGSSIRVTNIEPGMVETDFSLVRFKGDESKAEAVYAGAEALSAYDIAETVHWSIAQPPHVNINRIEVMPTCQAPAGLRVVRG